MTKNRIIMANMIGLDEAIQIGLPHVFHENRHIYPSVQPSFLYLENAVLNKQLPILQELHRRGHTYYESSAYFINVAANNGEFEMVKWLYANGYTKYNTNAFENAAKNNHTEIVKWLHNTCAANIKANNMAMNYAIMNNNLEIVEWLTSKNYIIPFNAILDAKQYKHNDIVNWLNNQDF